MQRNTASKWIVFAFGDEGHANPGEPVPSDAANITANLYLDGSATPNAVDDTNPTELGGGYYAFDITAAESNADNIVIVPASATANVNVIGVPGAVYPTSLAADLATVDTVVDGIKAVTDALPDSGALTSIAQASALATVDTNVDAILVDTAEIGTAGAGLTDLGGMSSAMLAEVQSEANDALVALGLDHLVSAAVAGADVADDSIIAKLVSSAATADWDTFVNTTDALQALRDRGDAAWTTGGGGSISDIIAWEFDIPPAMDLANTAEYRLAIHVTNALDDLPSALEITPGTVEIFRKAQGGTTWANPTGYSGAQACDESAGIISFDAVFSTANGFESGDMLRFVFKGQTVTVSANDYEICDGSVGVFKYSGIVADTPDVNVAQINGSASNVAKMNLFFSLLNGSGQVQSGTLADAALSATKFADGFLTSAKLSAGAVTTIQSGLATEAKQDLIDTVVDAIKAVTDNLPNSGALTDLIADVAAVLVDTGTTLPATLGTPAGVSVSADVAAVKAQTAAIETDTQDIQTRLPAALNNGVMPADVQRINDVEITGDGQAGTEFDVA